MTGKVWKSEEKAKLIFEAVKGKYGAINDESFFTSVQRFVVDAPIGIEHSDLAESLFPEPVRIDILSQAATLAAIEADTTKSRSGLIRWIHSQLVGRHLNKRDMRTQEFVADFGGEPPIAVSDIDAALDELDLFCSWAFAANCESSDSVLSSLLAYVYSSVIRIHPFCDANGRTARFVVQYAMRVWGRPIMPIPKVRNDPIWHHTLAEAVDGRFAGLASEFLIRLEQQSGVIQSLSKPAD